MPEFVNICRVCSGKIKHILLKYKNVPESAQNFLRSYNFTGENIKTNSMTLRVVQCEQCGLVQLDNLPVSYYKDVIRSSECSEEMKKFKLKQFMSFINNFDLKGKKVIEVGCGQGELLSVLATLEVDPYGIENNKQFCDICQKKSLNVQNVFLEGTARKIQNGPFDGFISSNILEHLPDPNSYLRGIYNNTTKDVIGLIEVPNFTMMEDYGLFSEFVIDHISYFTEETLEFILNINGFDMVEIDNTVCNDYTLSVIVQKKRPVLLDIDRFNSQQDKITEEIKEYVEKFDKVAVYSAGHQSFTVLSLVSELAKKTVYIIDDAPSKQTKLSPLTNIPIVGFSYILTDVPDAIIVIGGGYSGEMVNKIKKNMKINIAVLEPWGLDISESL